MRIIHSVTEEAVRRAIDEWVCLLADEKYSDASEYLLQEENVHWPPEMLKDIVSNYRASREQTEESKVSKPDDTSGGLTPRHDITLSSHNPEYLGEAWYDMPVLRKWSDLTATFLLKEHQDGALLILEDLRVM